MENGLVMAEPKNLDFAKYMFVRNDCLTGWFPTALLAPQPSVGLWVLLHHLKKSPLLNGSIGRIIGHQTDRWQVQLSDCVVAVKEQHLRFATSKESILAWAANELSSLVTQTRRAPMPSMHAGNCNGAAQT